MERTLHPLAVEKRAVGALPIGLEYKGDMPFDVWQESSRKKLSELLGLERETCEPHFCVEYCREETTFRETRFVFCSEEDYYVPCHFLEPKEKSQRKVPVVICLQGHSTGMHISLGRAKFDGDENNISSGDRDFAMQAVAKGLCAVTVEQRCFGERGGTPRPNCHSASLTALLSGRTMIGGRVWDIMRVIDMLEEHFADKCDVNAVYCTGNSGGGTATFYAAALERRIAAAMPSCALCTFEDSIGALNHCECNYVPNIRKYFDMAEICGMIAPRPLVIVSGEKDGIFPIDGAKHEFERAKNVYYAESPNPENAVHVIGPEGHRFYADLAWRELFRLTGADRH